MKKIVRLTESQLHNVIKESVKKIINEMPHPLSWDAVARRYDETDPEKASYARQRAATAWNRKFGQYNVLKDTNREHQTSSQRMRTNGNNYMVDTEESWFDPINTEDSYMGSTNEFNPQNNTRRTTFYRSGRNMSTSPNIDVQHNTPKGWDVAQQMAQGNGVYDKNRGGWQ